MQISPSMIYNFVKVCEASEDINLIDLVILQNDKVLAQFCKKPYRKDGKRLLFSMTKSFTSLAVGIAIDKKLINLNDTMASFFQEELPKCPHPNLLKMQIRHLLTMTTGLHDNTYADLFPQKNWVKAFLAQNFPHEPGTYYRYSTHATHMLSAIIQKISGMSLEDFLNSHLFLRMGIKEVQWERSPEGLIAGGMGLSLNIPSLIKIVHLLINKGLYKKDRIISEDYITLATSTQAIKQDDKNNPNQYFFGHHYGFQFHISQDNTYRADGAFGQFCVIRPDRKVAIIATSQKTKTERFLEIIHKYLINAVSHTDDISQKQLSDYLSGLSFPCPAANGAINKVPQCAFSIEANELNIKTIRFYEKKLSLIFSDGIQDEIAIDFTQIVYGKSHFIKDLQVHLQEHGVFAGWENVNILRITIYYIETPYVGEYRFQFVEGKVIFTFSINVNMTLKGFTVVGKEYKDHSDHKKTRDSVLNKASQKC